MRSGPLRARVGVYAPTRVTAATGQRVEGDGELLGVRWADVREAGAVESAEVSEQLTAARLYQVDLRADSLTTQLTFAHWLIYEGRRLNIVGTLRLGPRRELVRCTAREPLTP